jgi:hypothetical protein
MITEQELAEINNIFGYHPGTDVTVPQHEEVRFAFLAFAKHLLPLLPDGRAKEVVKTKLQEASMFSNFAVAELAPVVPPVERPPSESVLF